MNEAVRIGFLKAHTGLPLLTLMLVLYKIHGQNTSRAAPAGCIYDSDSVMWICDFKTWIPPLQDEDFGLAPWYYLELNNINGNIPAGVMFMIPFLHVFSVFLSSENEIIITTKFLPGLK